jgi:hypothetical protein
MICHKLTLHKAKYQKPESSEVLKKQFIDLEKSVQARISALFGGE